MPPSWTAVPWKHGNLPNVRGTHAASQNAICEYNLIHVPGAGEYNVFSCKHISKVPRTHFLKWLGKLTEHSRAGDAFCCCSADCVEWLAPAEHCTHPERTNCCHHLKTIVISGRLHLIDSFSTQYDVQNEANFVCFLTEYKPKGCKTCRCRNSHGDLATK